MVWYLAPLPYLALKTIEKARLAKYYQKIPIRIHVNGTRGKSSVVRLITAGLQASNIRVLGKVTGETPCLIGSQGERVIRRRGPASIGEQLWTLAQAARLNADVAVLECMALHPHLQIASEGMIKSQIGVITNINPDHLDIIGETPQQVAKVLAATIPYRGTLFVPSSIARYFKEAANKRNTKLVAVSEHERQENRGNMWGSNLALAIAVCRHLGVSDQDLVEHMAKAPTGAGSFRLFQLDKQRFFISAFTANDLATTTTLLSQSRAELAGKGQWIGLFNNRHDRNYRIPAFEPLINAGHFDRTILVGHWHYRFRRWPNLFNYSQGRHRPIHQLLADLPENCRVFAFGNFRGAGEEILRFVEGVGEEWIPKV